jgi:hypothetical protein
MSVDLTGIGSVATAAEKILGMIFPDKTAIETQKMAAAFSLISAQTDIDKAEAQSSDPLQHWRGGLGWVCTLAYFYSFLVYPLLSSYVHLAKLDITELSALTFGMLGLGAMHVTQTVMEKK